MRKILMLALVCAVLSVSAAAGEALKTHKFMDGLYTFKTPAAWVVEPVDADNSGVAIKPSADSPAHLMIAVPNPHVPDEDLEGFLGANLKVLDKQFGGIEVMGIEEEKLGELNAFAAGFTFSLADTPFIGLAIVAGADDTAITIIAFHPSSDTSFSPAMQEVLESLELNGEVIEKLADRLDAIGEKALREIGELIGD